MVGFELRGFSAITAIGRGGFSEIFQATDELTGRSVALKVMESAGIPAVAYGAFRREAEALGTLGDHPHIVTLYQALESDGRMILVLELCQASAEDVLARSGPFPASVVLDYGIKTAGALQTAHDRDILHRDIKPQNLLITRYGEPALADFGIARLRASSAQVTATGARAFTAVHAPPEVLQGGAVGGASDVYELASTLHTLLSGRPPFAGEDGEPIARTILRILGEPAPRIARTDGPSSLADLLERCLAKDPADRPETPLRVAHELIGIQASIGVVPTDVTIGAGSDRTSGVRHVLAPSASRAEPGAERNDADPTINAEASGAGSLDPQSDEAPEPGVPSSVITGNLPADASSFVGRGQEVREIFELLGSARLVTLAGAGGTGKTRIAVRVGRALRSQRLGGVWFVDLAPLSQSDSVSAAIADALALRPEPGRGMTESFGAALGERDSLLILDNCEHMRDQCARVAGELMRATGKVQILATSREPLGIAGEHLYRVPPLGLPDGEAAADLEGSDAAELFIARSRAQRPDFALSDLTAPRIASICRRLDGIPLALELAASRLRAMSIEDLDERLDQRFRVLTGGDRAALPRHQTLAATIAWSYDLLGAGERTLLEQLAVFEDGFSLESVDGVCTPLRHGVDGELLDDLTSLVDKSLVQASLSMGTSRYRLLETVKEYARERLAERPGQEKEAQKRHAQFFLRLAETAATHWFTRNESSWLERIEREHENLHAAIRYFLETPGDVSEALRACSALRIYWRRRGKLVEAVALVERALASDPAAQDPSWRAHALRTAGSFLFDCGDTELSRRRLDEAIALARKERDFELVTSCLQEIAFILYRRGELDEVREITDQAVREAEASGDGAFLARMLCHRGRLTSSDDPVRARNDLERALEAFRSAANAPMIAYALDGLAGLEMENGNPRAARERLEEGLAYAIEARDVDQLQTWLINLAFATLLEGDHATALDYTRRAVGAGRDVRIAQLVPYHLLAAALCVSGEGDHERAARLHGAATSALEARGESYEKTESHMRDQDHLMLRAALGAERFAELYDAGRRLGPTEAIALAGLSR